ncbi:Belongs to the MIP aquaporin (TC 1.A.8) [Dionaea muscipula]
MAKIALGTIREVRERGCLNALIVEFISTFLFVFAGVGSAMAADKLEASPLLGLFFVGLAHALVVAVMISAAFSISGGHLNPAVTLGLAMGGHITIFRSILYWIDQLAAAVVACILLKYFTGGLVSPMHCTLFFISPLYLSMIVFFFFLKKLLFSIIWFTLCLTMIDECCGMGVGDRASPQREGWIWSWSVVIITIWPHTNITCTSFIFFGPAKAIIYILYKA